jgi:hypothetical protein
MIFSSTNPEWALPAMTNKKEGFGLCRFVHTLSVIIQRLLVGLRLDLTGGSLARNAARMASLQS